MKRYSDTFKDHVLELLAAGHSVPEIRKKTDASESLLYRWKAEARALDQQLQDKQAKHHLELNEVVLEARKVLEAVDALLQRVIQLESQSTP